MDDNKLFKFLIFLNFVFITIEFHCVDEDNNFVDWYYIYKLPKIKHHPNKLIKKGIGYAFITSDSISGSWILSNYSINHTKSLPALTLNPIYSKKSKGNTLKILYNDEPPNKNTNEKNGHAKGVVLLNETIGLWLIHSVPLFPDDLSKHYNYPNNGVENGQSFLCISIDINQMNSIGLQLKYNEINIYSSKISKILSEQVENLVDVVNEKFIQEAPWNNLLNFSSSNNISQFISFAKSKHFNKELYFDWIAPTLNSDLFVETWQNGPGKISSKCSKFNVQNIEEIYFNFLNATFTSTKDHSKWTISNKNNWICVGDINRVEHQLDRGGGTVCTQNAKIKQAYYKLISKIEKCDYIF